MDFFETEYLYYILRIICAGVCGILVGFERQYRSKEAGIRTHFMVACGAALMMVISKYAFFDVVSGGIIAGADIRLDPSRVASTIVSGVGFLGAGTIFVHKNTITGLTTAAGLWATAGIGMACGGGMWLLAIGATVMLIFFQWLFHRNWKIFKHKKHYIVRIVFEQRTDEREQIKQIFETDRYNSLVIDREGDKLVYHAKLYTDIEYSSSQLNEIIEKHPFIYTLEREDDN